VQNKFVLMNLTETWSEMTELHTAFDAKKNKNYGNEVLTLEITANAHSNHSINATLLGTLQDCTVCLPLSCIKDYLT